MGCVSMAPTTPGAPGLTPWKAAAELLVVNKRFLLFLSLWRVYSACASNEKGCVRKKRMSISV